MATGLLDQRANFSKGAYVYGYGGDGTTENAAGKREIDCSHLLHKMLLGAGYKIPYQNTSALLDSKYFDSVELASVLPGDIVLWVNARALNGALIAGHVGVVETELDKNFNGRFFGSQSSTGPASARFGPKSGYWPVATKFLRPRSEYFDKPADQAVSAQIAPSTNESVGHVAAATTRSAPMRFSYPFLQSSGKPYESDTLLFEALTSEASGSYLIGKGNFFHGGIHITDKVAPHCKDRDMVRCIADGTVVAYRLNRQYLETSHKNDKLCYSTGFCLVRHDYASPVGSTGKRNTLTFYSLYMHLAAYSDYKDKVVKKTYKITEPRLRARSKPALGDDYLGYISIGAHIEVFETEDVKSGDAIYVFANGIIKSGNVKNSAGRVVTKIGDSVWIALEKKGNAADQYAKLVETDRKVQPCYWAEAPELDKVVVCNVPIGAGDVIGRLGLYEVVANSQGGKVSKHQVHLEVFTFDPALEAFLKNAADVKHDNRFHFLAGGTKLWIKSDAIAGADFIQTDEELPRDLLYSPGVPKEKGADGKEWMNIEFMGTHQQFYGYVPVERAEMVGPFDWAKMGFQKIEAPASFDGYLPPILPPSFFQDLYQKVTGNPAPIDRESIRKVLISEKYRHAWSKIVVKQISDWKHGSKHSVWSVLDRIMKKSPEIVAHERERIDSCVWWDEVAAKIPGFDEAGEVWHFHPVAFVAAARELNCVEEESEEFRVFVSTVYGEAAGQSKAAWACIGWVINNRVNYREWRKHKTVSDVIKNTGFDAYTHKTRLYSKAYDYLAGNSDVAPDRLLDMIKVLRPVFSRLASDCSKGSVLYYSPKAQKALSKSNPGMYRETPKWNFDKLERVFPEGVEDDDFAFYKYK